MDEPNVRELQREPHERIRGRTAATLGLMTLARASTRVHSCPESAKCESKVLHALFGVLVIRGNLLESVVGVE